MIFLYGYLGIGLAILGAGATATAVMGMAKRLKKGDAIEPSHNSLATSESASPEHSRDFYDLFGIPTLIILLVITVWPILIYVVGHMIFWGIRHKNNPSTDATQEFFVKRQHLQECLTLEEIEKREMVMDPLKAVPALPFGHLNAAWIRFLSKLRNSSELWSFSARWESAWGRNELRAGYVEVHNGSPGIYFLTEWKDLPSDAKLEDKAKQSPPYTNFLLRWLDKYPAD
jgi:hypothetical protein